jgi:hypothetical protein
VKNDSLQHLFNIFIIGAKAKTVILGICIATFSPVYDMLTVSHTVIHPDNTVWDVLTFLMERHIIACVHQVQCNLCFPAYASSASLGKAPKPSHWSSSSTFELQLIHGNMSCDLGTPMPSHSSICSVFELRLLHGNMSHNSGNLNLCLLSTPTLSPSSSISLAHACRLSMASLRSNSIQRPVSGSQLGLSELRLARSQGQPHQDCAGTTTTGCFHNKPGIPQTQRINILISGGQGSKNLSECSFCLLHSLSHVSIVVLSLHDCVWKVFLELQKRRVIPQLQKAKYMLYFPAYRSRSLFPTETLGRIGAQDGSTLFLRVLVLGGTSEAGAEENAEHHNPQPELSALGSSSGMSQFRLAFPQAGSSLAQAQPELSAFGSSSGMSQFRVAFPPAGSSLVQTQPQMSSFRISKKDTGLRLPVRPKPSTTPRPSFLVSSFQINSTSKEPSESSHTQILRPQKRIRRHSPEANPIWEDYRGYSINDDNTTEGTSAAASDRETESIADADYTNVDDQDSSSDSESDCSESVFFSLKRKRKQKSTDDKATKSLHARSLDNTPDTTDCLAPPPEIPQIKSQAQRKQIKITMNKTGIQWRFGQIGHSCDHAQDALVPLSSPINSSCAFLSFMNRMYFCPLLGAILCPIHQALVPMASLKEHLSKEGHDRRLTVIKREKFEIGALIDHVKEVFALPENQDYGSLINRLSEINAPCAIPGLKPQFLCMQCPSCFGWFSSSSIETEFKSGLRAHWKDRRNNCKRPEFETVFRRAYVQQWAPPASKDAAGEVKTSLARVVLDVNLQSQKKVSSVAIQKALYSSLPSEYLANIGWVSYIDGLQVKRPYLIQLVALPSMRMAEMWPNDSEGWRIECGLLGLYSFLAEYLWHANCRVNACDDLIRVGLTAG